MQNKYDGILILSDIDGTLVHNCILSEETENAVREFVRQGGKFTVATGRTPQYIKDNYQNRIAINAPIAAINGAVVASFEPMELIYGKELPVGFEKVVHRIRDLVKTERVMAYTFNDTIRIEKGFEKTLTDTVYKLLAVTLCEEDAIFLRDTLRKEYSGEYSIMRSWNTGVEIISRGAGKGMCLEKIKEITNSKITIGIGDYENDITLVQSADIGIATENAVDELKEYADIVAVSSDKHPVKQVIENLEEIIKKLS